MPALFIASLLGALATMMGSLVGRVLIALGIGFVTYKGVGVGLDAIKQQVISGVSGLPGEALGMVGYLWLDKALTVVFSAFVTALSMRLVGGGLKRMTFK